jgi:hypothetical protein
MFRGEQSTERTIRISYWVCAVLLGAVQTWYMRHRIFSDGISYLAIAQAYLRGDWHNALSTYWSPLYSWLVAGYLWLFRPSPYWEASSLHVVNYFAFLVSCFTFEKFVVELMKLRMATNRHTILATAYVTILYGGLVLIGIGYVSPDMIAYAVVGAVAWLTVRMGWGTNGPREYIAMGLVLGLGFLDRSAFAALIPLYVAAAALVLWRRGVSIFAPVMVMAAALIAVTAPFLVAVSADRGRLALGDTGKLNYGWEVNGASRWSHWQGEPYNIGKPEHPERLILKDPVPVFEFREPVAGPYPPWYDPSYWYAGIQPRFDLRQQIAVLRPNVFTAVLYFLLSPALPLALLLLVSGGRRRAWAASARKFYPIVIPILAGTAMYCLIFVDKRYLAGFVGVVWILLLVELDGPAERFRGFADPAARVLCALVFVGAILSRMAVPVAALAGDVAHGGERDLNFNWMMAKRLGKIGVRPGDRIAFIGLAKDADWVRILECRTVAEVPIVFETSTGLLNSVIWDQRNIKTFLKSDDASRERVYDAFRKAGAVMAIAVPYPREETARGWKRVIEPTEPGVPKHDGQFAEQFPSYYRWLVPGR